MLHEHTDVRIANTWLREHVKVWVKGLKVVGVEML